MKPKIIFSTVGTICLLLLILLPNLAMHMPASARVQAAVLPAVQSLPTSAPTTLPTVLPSAPAADPATADPATVSGAAVNAAQAATLAPPAAPSNPGATLAPMQELILSDGSDAALAATAAANSVIPDTALPTLQQFAASLINNTPGQATGLYAPGLFALSVVQQPAGDGDYVDGGDNTVTQYSRAAGYNVTGLLAHNYLSGHFFAMIPDGQELYLVLGDGSIDRYRVRAIQHYQALDPHNTASDFLDLDQPGSAAISHLDLFQRVYTTANDLVLQTCIASGGELSWGRLFVIAVPE